MITSPQRTRFIALISFVVGLAACGGGGGGGGDGTASFPTYPATAADSMLLPVVTAAGELKLFNPAAPTSAPVTVDTGLELPFHFGGGTDAFPNTSVMPAFGATYDGVTNAVMGFHRRFAWYFKDGTAYRVDLLNTSSHTPVQFSANTDICDFNGFAGDYNNPLSTRFSVRTTGADTTCYTGDDVGRYFTFGASAADAGAEVPPDFFLIESVLATNGSLQRVLSYQYETGEFTANAPDLSSSTLLAATEEFTGGPDQSRTRQYYRLQPVGGDFALYRYDADAGTLTPIHTYASAGFSVADTDYLYFMDGDQVFRLAHTSTTPEPIHTVLAPIVVDDLDLTTNRLVFLLRDFNTGATSLETLPKAGGATRTVLQDLPSSDLTLVATGGSRVYYNVGNGIGGASAVRVQESGSDSVVVDNARWVGTSLNPDTNIGALNPEDLARTLLLGEVDDLGVGTLRGVDARTGIDGPVLGTIDGAVAARTSLYNYGRYAMVNVLVDRGFGTPDFDAYFVDIPTADSLRAAAATFGLDDAAP